MEFDALDMILAGISAISFVYAILSEQYRLIALISVFILLVIIVISKQNKKIKTNTEEQKRIKEKLKIHEQFIEIRADTKELQRRK